MTKRIAALLALVAFAVAWLVGVARGAGPLTRLENAGLALVAAFVAGLGIGVALEKIVLARLTDSWRPRPRQEADRDGEPTFGTASASARAAAAATGTPATSAPARETEPAEAVR